jgi:copper chaperone CopZ
MLLHVRKLMLCLFLTALFPFAGGALAGDLSRTTMKVSNLYCGSCLTHIDATLQKMSDVVGLRGDLAQGIVQVDHQPALSGEKIAAIITELGYPARIVSEDNVTSQDSFATSSQDGYAASCCSVGARSYGCGSAGSQRYGCSASSAAWKKLFRPQAAE